MHKLVATFPAITTSRLASREVMMVSGLAVCLALHVSLASRDGDLVNYVIEHALKAGQLFLLEGSLTAGS